MVRHLSSAHGMEAIRACESGFAGATRKSVEGFSTRPSNTARDALQDP